MNALPPDASYFYADPDTLRYDYTEVLEYIQTDKVETVYVNQFENVTQELKDVKAELTTLKKTLDPEKHRNNRKTRYKFKE